MKKWIMGAALGLLPAPVFAEYTALIQASDFTGIKTDAGTAAAGVISVCLIVMGLTVLIRTFRG